MEKIFKKIIMLLLITVTISCDLDGDLKNPNEVGLEDADPNLLMNGIQLDLGDFFSLASGNTVYPDHTTFGVDRLMRMRAMNTGFRYQTAAQAQWLDDIWKMAYSNVLVNAEALIPLAESKNMTTHVAVAKIIKAYVYITLVDLFGDVPDTNALKGIANFNPTTDNGSDIYTHAITLLNEARTELAKTGQDAGPALTRDIYYNGSRAKWNALANTLELKTWLNLSMIPSRAGEANARITTLLAGDLVDEESENFTYKYGTATVPVSRHPTYRQYYTPSEGGATGYIANYFMNELYKGKPDPLAPTDVTKFTQDPRWRYYFYRQVGSLAQANRIDPSAIGCSIGAIPTHYASGGHIFCTFDPGFYGRDHGDASGTPPDSQVITCAGAYPAGGKTDTNPISNKGFAEATIQGDGGNGAGIEPIFMSFFTDYMKAEILARRGDVANAKVALMSAVTKSITQVKNFSNTLGQSVPASIEPSTSDYMAAVSYLYDNTTNKLDVIGKEFYIACWGNAIEAYNNYRRTSAPRNIQPTLQVNAGPFLRTLVYPAVFVNLNTSVGQKDYGTVNKVFWDTNPDNLN